MGETRIHRPDDEVEVEGQGVRMSRATDEPEAEGHLRSWGNPATPEEGEQGAAEVEGHIGPDGKFISRQQ